MAVRDWTGRFIAYFWQGPPDLRRELKLEWRFVAVRWIGILFMAPVLSLAHLPADRLQGAYAVLVVAALYNLAIQWLMLRRPRLFISGYVTTLGDSLLDIAMVNVGGGFGSPFYFILFTVSISAAMRYGYGPSLAMSLIFVSFDAWEQYRQGNAVEASFVFRSGFLVITTLMAGYLREQAQRAEAALQERLRQANLLNEATALLGTSLEYEPVLAAVAAAAARLFESRAVVIQPARESEFGAAELLDPICYPAGADALPVHEELAALASRYSGPKALRVSRHELIRWETLSSGQPALVLVFGLPNRQLSLATLAVELPNRAAVEGLDRDILDSFVERTTLAIENASLYRTLASRSEDLQRAYADLAAAHQELLGVDEMKTNFLANVSHELRTPLSSIRSFSELLLTYDDDGSVRQEFLQIINAESERLTRLIDDVLDITKIESGKMDWHMGQVELNTLLRDTARTYAALIETHGLAFEQDIAEHLPTIRGDRDRLQQVFGNLLNNAVKFTRQGSIRLAARQVENEVWVSVADTGIGISREDQSRIFEKFQQVGAMLTEKPKGTGLGLSICREIVDHHGGRIWVESEPGAGSTFTVALPIHEEEVAKAGAGSPTSEASVAVSPKAE